MPNTSDGGRTALAGYLYQIVGLLGMSAYARCADASSSSAELDALLTLVRTGELRHEYLDQDVVLWQLGIDSDDKCVLVQFKFSRQISDSSIGPKELRGIVRGLARSAKAARGQGLEVTGYVLATNRPLGSFPTEPKHRDQRIIQQQLRVVTPLHLSEWEEALAHFAHRLGAEEAEIESGIYRLIGEVVYKTVEMGETSVTEADLRRVFTGYQHAREITLERVIELSSQEIGHFFERLGLQGEPIRRELLLDEIARAASERALVVLHGLGGCGKTVALWQWAREVTTTSPLDARASAISPASEISRSWVTETICEWARLPVDHLRRSERSEHALKRLLIANPNALPPIVCLGLDGLDEGIAGSEQKYAVQEILRWFWEEDDASHQQRRPPQATLVVTCRNAEDITGNWLHLDLSGFEYRGREPMSLKVGDFSADELIKAAQIGLPALCGRIESALQTVTGYRPELEMDSREPRLLGSLGPSAPKAETPMTGAPVLEALLHPAMWRALLELDFGTQPDVLDGRPQAVQKLAEVFVRRFCTKVRRRGQVAGLSEEAVLDVLCAIAHHCQDNGRIQQSMADWLDPACETTLISRFEARVLYSEALSGGVISQDNPRLWRWRHGLVWDYLAEANVS